MPPAEPAEPAESTDRRVVAAVVAAVGASFAAVALIAALARPSDPAVPGPGFDAQFLNACTRAGVADDECRCGLQRWLAAVPAEQLATVDSRLADGGDLPVALRSAVEGCRAG